MILGVLLVADVIHYLAEGVSLVARVIVTTVDLFN